jgi:hypothetical protein
MVIQSWELAIGVIILGCLQFLLALWITERLKAALQRETNAVLEKMRWDFKVREQAAKVAEYMALARNLREDSPEEDYRMANRLAWELAMWLPADTYKALGKALATPDASVNPLSVAIAVRGILLGPAAGDLAQDHVIQHAPAIGKQRR